MTQMNQLGDQESQYLQRHAGDPVAWQLWSPETLDRARSLDKPILLSIGYSACHWCQVMQRESFSNTDIAALMDELFVCIKVDKEERPDLDDIFQTAHELLNGQPGGWPLTVFLCPKTRLPFVAGTYFPQQPMEGRIPFEDLLIRVNKFYRHQHRDFLNLREQMGKSFKALNEQPAADAPEYADLYLVHEANARLLEKADVEYGGFSGTPKFTMPFYLWRLLESVSERTEQSAQAQAHLKLTLDRMAGSALHDIIGGGFFRYAADRGWAQPHFEKMLFDNAALLGLYSAAASILNQPLYEVVAQRIFTWMQDCMAVANGLGASLISSASAEDPMPYCFTKDDIKATLSEAEYVFFDALYGFDFYADSNFLLHAISTQEGAAERLHIDFVEAQKLFETGRVKLRELQLQKPVPALDEKVLCSWNALAAKSMAQMARYLGDKNAMECAQTLVDKLTNKLWYNKRLFSIARKSGERLPAFIDDYAFLLAALLEMLRVQWRDTDYCMARQLAEGLLNHFYDPACGGFFFVAHDHEELPFRPKPYADTMTPSGNGAAALALLHFGYLTAEPRYIEVARHCIETAMPLLRRQPEAHCTLLQAMRESILPKPVVLLRGDDVMIDWQLALLSRYRDQVYSYQIPTQSEFHPPEVMVMEENTAVLCRADQCEEKAYEQLSALLAGLDEALSLETVMEALA